MKTNKSLLTALSLLFLSITAFAQITGTTGGVPPFSSFAGDINVANLNVHTVIPVRSANGVSAWFINDNNFWANVNGAWTYPSSSTGSHQIFGLGANIGGATSFQIGGPYCGSGTDRAYTALFTDATGFVHSFPGVNVDTQGCTYPETATGYDIYGYYVSINATSGTPVVSVTDLSGTVYSGLTSTDRNGNQITVTTAGNPEYIGLTGQPVLTQGGVGGPYYYNDQSGTQRSFTVTTTNYTLQTNFGCSGITEFPASPNNPLPTTITLPDTSTYQITYEITPGHSPHVTGRIASITLPTGGVITYTYNGANHGISCADGGASGFKVATPDGTWTYARTVVGSQWQTVVTAPSGQTVTYLFTGDTSGSSYEVSRTYAESGGAVVGTILTCYNGNTSNCSTYSYLPTNIPTEIAQFTELPNASGRVSEVDTLYNSVGLPTSVKTYDFGAGSPGSLIDQKTIAYGSWTGSTCTALGNNIKTAVCYVQDQDGSGNYKSATATAYDQTTPTALGATNNVPVTGSRGNPTTVYASLGSTTLNTVTKFYDTGAPQSITEPNGNVAAFWTGSRDCGHRFPIKVSNSVGLQVTGTWDCNGGVTTGGTDVNGNPVSQANGSVFWQLTSVTDQTGAQTTILHNPYYAESTLSVASNAVVDSTTVLDTSGRPDIIQIKQSPTASNYDTMQIYRDSTGRQNGLSLPCSTTFELGCTKSTASVTYDAMNRALVTTDAGGGTVTNVYTGQDTVTTLGPATTLPATENLKSKSVEVDALGRITSVCEITSMTGSGNCAQVNSKTGFWTKYAYTTQSTYTNTVTITQNAQGTAETRTKVYDLLGRMISETNPESGTTTYTYNSTTGDLSTVADANGNTISYTYDLSHRPLSITYSGPNAGLNKYFVYDTALTMTCASCNNAVLTNTKGNLVEAYTAPSSSGTKTTDEEFSYTARGEVSTFYQYISSYPSDYYISTAAYYPNGSVSQLYGTNNFSMPIATYGLDGEARVYSLSLSGGINPLTATSYGLDSQAMGLTFTSNTSANFTYDASTGRMLTFNQVLPSGTESGTLTWNKNGSLQQLVIADPQNSADAQTCKYGADDLLRLISVACGSPWAQTFSYDAFGNLKQSGSANFNPNYTTKNQITGLSGFSYDSNGNLLGDATHSYTWDAENKPATIDTSTLTYDALGRIVDVYNGSAHSQRVYTAGVTAYMSGITLSYARLPLPNGADYDYEATTRYYHVPDWIGSYRFGHDSSNTSNSQAFAPFGETYAKHNTGNYAAFTGLQNDEATDLYDADLRKVASAQGRWISPDTTGANENPLNPQSFNRYAYANGNPVLFTDPSGADPGDPSPTPPGPCSGQNTGVGCTGDENTGNGFTRCPYVTPDGCGIFPHNWQYFEEDSVDTGFTGSGANMTGWLGTMAAYGTFGLNSLFSGARYVSNQISRGSDWANDHPLVTFPLAIALAAYGNNDGPIEEDAEILEEEGQVLGQEATALAQRLGRAGEEALGITGPKAAIRIPGSGVTRFPDQLTSTMLGESKNVAYQSFTQQLRDYQAYSQANGLQFNLTVRSTTRLSGPLQYEIGAGRVNLSFFPGGGTPGIQ